MAHKARMAQIIAAIPQPIFAFIAASFLLGPKRL